jgi:predicted ABC-type transport system involved in lysophospholipase L1 biosynthesis ATPase subunit
VEAPLLELTSLIKDYRGLRPLRIERLVLAASDHVAIVGLDLPAAQTLVDLIVAAALPDQGEVRVFGRSTASIEKGVEWLALADRFGIVSTRAVLLDMLSVVQNLAIPFSLEIEPPSPDLRTRAEALARDVGLDRDLWERPVAQLDAAERSLVRLGRALALNPAVLLLEHPTADVPRERILELAHHVRRSAGGRRAATLTLTADSQFAGTVADRVLFVEAASGRLTEPSRGWFG